MTEEKKVAAFKFTLPTKKTILLREPRIKDNRIAAKAVGLDANGNQMLSQVLVQEEMVKLLLLEVDGKKVTLNQKEDLDSLFTAVEFGFVVQAVNKIVGGENTEGKLIMEGTEIGLS